VIETFLNKQSDDPVAVENEICSVGRSIPDHSVLQELRHLLHRHANALSEVTYVSKAMSWGVCGRTWTLSNDTPFEMVAVGFSSSGW
jgi:hypothetical protein